MKYINTEFAVNPNPFSKSQLNHHHDLFSTECFMGSNDCGTDRLRQVIRYLRVRFCRVRQYADSAPNTGGGQLNFPPRGSVVNHTEGQRGANYFYYHWAKGWGGGWKVYFESGVTARTFFC